MHVVETFGETKGEKGQRLAAEGGRLAVHSLSARNSRDRQAATATAAAILRPAHLAHSKLWKTKINSRGMLFSSLHACLFASLDVLGFPHSARHSLSQTGLFPHRTPLSALRTSLTQCALPLRAISARAWGIWAMVLDGPFPQFRSHGRIDGTGPGNFRARLSSKP